MKRLKKAMDKRRNVVLSEVDKQISLNTIRNDCLRAGLGKNIVFSV